MDIAGSWNYDPTESTDADKVRGLIGDVDKRDPLISDEQVAAALAAYTTVRLAAAACAEHLAARFARDVDTISTGGMTTNVAKSQRCAAFRALAKDLRRHAAYGAIPYAGGIRQSDKAGDAADTDRKDAFTDGQFDNPRAA